MSYVLGIDLGTSSLKGLLVNKKGRVICTSSCDYPLITLQKGYSEQDPQNWFIAVKKVIRNIINEVPEASLKLEAISFSGQMHSLVLLDEENRVLRNAILWNDVRTSPQCGKINDVLKEDLIKITKNKALEGFTLPKMLWIKENEPDLWDKVKTFLLPKDYLGFCLTGNKQIEYSDAAGTLLLDIEKKEWSKKILDTFKINRSICPKLVCSTEKIGNVKEELLSELGIQNSVSVFSGGADNPCAAIGSGIVKENNAMISIGTSGVFLSYEEDGSKNYDGQLHFFNHVIEDSFYSMGVTLAAGHSLSWFKNTFAENDSFESLLEGIAKIAPGADGLLFSPYIIGERTPYIDSKIRGSFIGIDTMHTKKHFVKAIIEGITFSLMDSKVLMEKYMDKRFDKIVSVGGGAKSNDWLQIQADIFDSSIVTLETEQGPAMGAAMIAAVGIGWYNDLISCAKDFVVYKDKIQPIKENVEKYKKVYNLYRKIYSATKEISHELLKLNFL